MENSFSLLELFSYLEEVTDTKLNYVRLPVRESDQRVFVACLDKAKEILKWEPKVSSKVGVKRMLDWLSHKE